MVDSEAIEKQIEEYRKQEEVAIANVHRIQGARIALETLLKQPANGVVEEALESITAEK